MGKRIRRTEDWCPECGHLLPKKKWDCQFCGWSLSMYVDDTMIEDAAGSELDEQFADVDRLIDKINADYLSTST